MENTSLQANALSVGAAGSGLNVLFLCSRNSARSIFAEYFTRYLSNGRLAASSAGFEPRGEVDPITLRILSEFYRIPAEDARSKSWTEFRGSRQDFVITVCDKALQKLGAAEFSGHPIFAHWQTDDPTSPDLHDGTERGRFEAFRLAAMEIYRRVELFCSLPVEKLDRYRLQEMVSAIGRQDAGAATPA